LASLEQGTHAMKIRMQDYREFEGTPGEIVRAMKDLFFGGYALTLAEYIDKVVENTLKFEEIQLVVTGQDDDARAASLVSEIVRAKLAVVIDAGAAAADA